MQTASHVVPCARRIAIPAPSIAVSARRLATSRRALGLAALLMGLAALAPRPASAEIGADELGFSVVIGVAEARKAPPTIAFAPSEKLSGVTLELARSDGRKSKVGVGNLAPGRERRVPIKQEKGAFDYVATVRGRSADGPFEVQLTFTLTVGAVPMIKIRAEDVDLEAAQLVVRVSEQKGHIELQVWDKDGDELDTVDQPYDAVVGSPIVVKWKQKPGQVAGKFVLKAYDVAEFWSGVESVTFMDIPHDDIVFESGKWDIRPTEETKLDAPLQRIAAEIAKVAGVLPITLYVAGYTDTVGSAADNLELSRKRAQSIAAWFRRRGLKVPILHQGFGEAALAVPTPDNTDEARNRRAVYVLATTAPPASAGFPGGAWQRL